jgi:hypothetical protein
MYIRASLFDFKTLQQNFTCQRLDLFLFPHSWADGPLALVTSALAAKFENKKAQINGTPLH